MTESRARTIERRRGRFVEFKLHIGSQITVYVDEQEPIDVYIKSIEGKGRGHYLVEGRGVSGDEYVTFHITR